MTITISECLRRLECGEIVELEVYQYDRKRQKGGHIDTFFGKLLQNDALESPPEPPLKHNNNKHTLTRRKFTYHRNVCVYADGQRTSVIRRLHPPLIRRFDGVQTTP
jgi:hypothetical protein